MFSSLLYVFFALPSPLSVAVFVNSIKCSSSSVIALFASLQLCKDSLVVLQLSDCQVLALQSEF